MTKQQYKPWFILLLPLFFVFHGYTLNFHFVTEKTAILLILTYILVTVFITVIFFLLSKSLLHAALMAAILMSFHFFFGPFHDFLKVLLGASLTRYSFVLIFLLLFFILLYLFLRKKDLRKFSAYLNLLFLLLILIDLAGLLFRNNENKNKQLSGFQDQTICDTCKKPDIFFIVLDGYAGARQLKDQFAFDNTSFFDALKSYGFKVIPESESNYDSSPTSVASTLNMDYLDSSKTSKMRTTGHRYAFEQINNNRLTGFLSRNGYRIYNNSVFKLAGQASPTGGSFIPANAKLVNGNTLIARLERDVLMNIATKIKLRFYLKKYIYAAQKDNNEIYQLTLDCAELKSSNPKFVYSHFMMPHHPYYYKANEQPYSFDELAVMPFSNQEAYLGYLQFTNNKILQLVRQIIERSGSSPLIAVISDHGFRYFQTGRYEDYAFSNLMAVRMPGGNYNQFKDSMTNVNLFRAILNTQFGLNLAWKKDSTSVIEF